MSQAFVWSPVEQDAVVEMPLFPLILLLGALLTAFLVLHALAKVKASSEAMLATYSEMLADAAVAPTKPAKSTGTTTEIIVS